MSVRNRLGLMTVSFLLAIGFAAILSGALVAPEEAAPGSGCSPRLREALAAESTDALHRVWVRFAPRPLAGDELAAALAAAQAELNPRTARRRARAFGSGQPLVQVADLPLDAARLAACEATGAVLHQQSRWLNAASFNADAEAIARLSRVPGVVAVDLVATGRRADVPRPVGPIVDSGRWPDSAGGASQLTNKTTAIDYGGNGAAMVQANVPGAHELGLTGAGVVVAMLDTGFRTTHEALAGIPVLGAWDFVNNDAIVDNEAGDPVSSINHGTMTLSTVAGHLPGQLVAPAFGVSVLLAKTEDVSQEVPPEEDDWVAGLEWAEAQGADIVSSSLGYIDWYVYADLDGNTAVTTIAADLAAGRGLIVVNSAGNDRHGSGSLIAPADADSIITVGAVDADGVTAYFSSPGPTADGRIKPDVAALGVLNTVADPTDDANYLNASGTSFSCPLVSGVVALMLERTPGLTPLQVREALCATASQSSAPDNDQGWGIIDATAAVLWFGPVIDHTPLAGAGGLGPFTVSAGISDRLGLDTSTALLHFRSDGGPWQVLPLAATGGAPDQYYAEIPAQAASSQVEYYLTAASLNGVATSLPYAAAAAPYGFAVTPASGVGGGSLPGLTVLGPNVPNPFNPQTTISFTLATDGPTSLRIFDLRGQLVRVLLDGPHDAGHFSVSWDGRDDTGRAVASGTYFSRLTGGDVVQQHKMMLVR